MGNLNCSSQRSQRPQREEEIKETEEALERDYMDYRITWIEAYMSSFLIQVILQSM
jgi:hypothetical protein